MTVSITTIRRQNLLALYREFAAQQLAEGKTAKGLDQDFAKKLEISPARWSQLKSPGFGISDKLAGQIEGHMGKEAGWLDVQRDNYVPDGGEERFIEAARAAWRAANAKGRRELLLLVKQRASGG